MGINIVGNINGSYHLQSLNLFELASKQEDNQPVLFQNSETDKGMPEVTVNISKEGFLALHGSKLRGSVDLKQQIKDMEYLSEHQPVESFENRLQKNLKNSYIEAETSVTEKGNTLFSAFKGMADEIVQGYSDGTRVRFVEDKSEEDGYRKLTETDELSILQSEFENFVNNRFGKQHQEESIKMVERMNELQKTRAKFGLGDMKQYQPEQIPDGFVEELTGYAKEYIESLSV